MASEGSGSFLSRIAQAKILNTWEKANIEYLNIIDLNNVNAKILDPFTIGLMIERGYDCISDAYEKDPNSDLIHNPMILENKFHYLDLYYPFEVERAIKFQHHTPEIFQWESLHLNMYTKVGFLINNLSKQTGKIFEYRIKQKNSSMQLNSFSSFIPWLCKSFSFEINAYNLMRLTNKTLLIKRNRSDVITHPDKGNKNMNSEFQIKSLDFLTKVLKQSPSKFLAILTPSLENFTSKEV
jgi:hypothetical protein